MRKITKEEYIKSTTKKRNIISIALDDLKVGEGLEIKKEEYRGKMKLCVFVGATYCKKLSNKKFSVKTLKDRSGWGVLRIK